MGVAPIESLDCGVIYFCCNTVAQYYSAVPLGGAAKDLLATKLLPVANWEEAPARPDALNRNGQYAQSAAAFALAVLVGSNEGDDKDFVALSEVRAPAFQHCV